MSSPYSPHNKPRSLDFIREQVKQDSVSGHFAGRVQTRFPPEPNGYLHIGHAKAICLNFNVAAENNGICCLRLDDTNPETESTHYVEAIEEDVAWLGFEPHQPTVYASDYFEQLYIWAEHLTIRNLAYVDDQNAETISATRGDFATAGVESPWRDRSPQENLALLRAMRAGRFPNGAKVLRARIDMSHPNMLMRDPVMYRIRHSTHFRTGNTWVIYPTYDWAHGQSDAIEGVTHSLCSLEFDTHRQLYDWFLEHIPLPENKTRPRQTEFARLNLTHTVTSKRKLGALVDQGFVEGWDDPRLPTLRGMRRRGYPPEAIRAFCSHIGVARVNGVHDIELLEYFIRTHLNRHASRRMAVLKPLEVVIDNWPEHHVEYRQAVNNPEDANSSTRAVPFTKRLWIEQDDFMLNPPSKFYRLAPGREVRLRSGYILRCEDVDIGENNEIVRLHCSYDQNTGSGEPVAKRRVRSTIHWVSTEHSIESEVFLYDRLFAEPHPDNNDPTISCNRNSRELVTGVKMEPALAATEPGEVVQFERIGYFARDYHCNTNNKNNAAANKSTAVANRLPRFHRTVGLRDEWAKIQKRRSASC